MDIDLYTEMYIHGRDKSKALFEKTGTDLLLVYQQMSKEAVTKGQSLSPNAFGMAAQTQSCNIISVHHLSVAMLTVSGFTAAATWQDDAHDEIVHEAIDSLGNEMADMASRKGFSRPQLFPNDATYSQNPMESFGSANVDKLRAVSRKYDPNQVFQKLQNGGFKLGLV